MSTPTTSPATSVASDLPTETHTPPRTRWAGIVWGLLFAAVSAFSLWLIADDDRRAGISDWVLSLTPVTITTLVILTIGVLLLVTGAAGLLRRVQSGTAARSSQHPLGDIRPE